MTASKSLSPYAPGTRRMCIIVYHDPCLTNHRYHFDNFRIETREGVARNLGGKAQTHHLPAGERATQQCLPQQKN